MTFGEKLLILRKDANMTQEELAKKLKVSRQAVTKWETDNGLPDIDNIIKISVLFNVSMDSLFNYKIETINAFQKDTETTIDKADSKLKNVEAFILNHFDTADEIYWLAYEKHLNVFEWIFDFFLGAGTLNLADYLRNGLAWSFLVKTGNITKIVLIYKEKMLIKELDEPFNEKKKIIDGYSYQKTKKLR